jgi:hypothetical protein
MINHDGTAVGYFAATFKFGYNQLLHSRIPIQNLTVPFQFLKKVLKTK